MKDESCVWNIYAKPFELNPIERTEYVSDFDKRV